MENKQEQISIFSLLFRIIHLMYIFSFSFSSQILIEACIINKIRETYNLHGEYITIRSCKFCWFYRGTGYKYKVVYWTMSSGADNIIVDVITDKLY